MFSKHDQWRKELVELRRVRMRVRVLLVGSLVSAALSWPQPELHWVGYVLMAMVGFLISEWIKASHTIKAYELAIMATNEDGSPILVERPSRAG